MTLKSVRAARPMLCIEDVHCDNEFRVAGESKVNVDVTFKDPSISGTNYSDFIFRVVWSILYLDLAVDPSLYSNCWRFEYM
jgi:hypothetical protein